MMSQQNRYSALNQSGEQSPPKKSSPKRKQFKNKPTTVLAPVAVDEQKRLRSKFQYRYRSVNNGNVENNSTLYVNTGVAHPHQVEEIFNEVIERSRNMPEVFGENFECDVQVNLVRKHNGQYMAYAFVDLSNPAV